MNKKARVVLSIVAFAAVIAIAALYLHGHTVAVLEPKGIVGQKERNLMVFAVLLMMIVVIPVFALTFGIAWKYRAGNTRAKYTPDWDHNRGAETLWWGIPSLLILVLSVLAWTSSHDLDPYKPLGSKVQPVTIQVVALDWKWLFIYPQQHIATVNYMQIPTGAPINFEVTSDAPMNSFWIPQLGGQIYAMPGMTTQLHLMADANGSYNGSSANISGVGFSGMKFITKATSPADFDSWVRTAQQSPQTLDQTAYTKLAKDSQNNPVTYYSSPASGLFDTIVMKYMMPMGSSTPTTGDMNMTGMGM